MIPGDAVPGADDKDDEDGPAAGDAAEGESTGLAGP
jgi:hypothetical protein